MELKNELNPSEAILDFEAKYFEGLFQHKAKQRSPVGYHQCYQAIVSARKGTMTFERAVRILTKYAPPGAYAITEKIEVVSNQPNGPAFKEAIEKIRTEGGEEIETKI